MRKMKRNRIALLWMVLILLGSAEPLFAQIQPTGNPILDAPALSQAIANLNAHKTDTLAMQAVLSIINANTATPYNTYAEMFESIKGNHFLMGRIPDLAALRSSKDTIADITALPKHASAEGLLSNPTDILDAAGSFIAERFKQEIEIAFLDNFKKLLNDPTKFPELSAFFPETKTVLLQNDPYQYTSFLESLKEAIDKDLNNLPENLGGYLAKDPFQVASTKAFYYPSVMVYSNVLKIVRGKSPLLVLNNLDQDPLLVRSAEPYQSVFRLLAVLARTFTNPQAPTANNGLIPLSKLQQSLNSEENIALFAGLFLEKEKDGLKAIKFKAETLYTILDNHTGRGQVVIVFNWVKATIQSYNGLSASYTNLINSVKTGSRISGSQVTDCVNSLAGIVNSVADFPFKDLHLDSPFPDAVTLDAITAQVKALGGIAGNIIDKNYGLALTYTISFLGDNLKEPAADILKKYGNFTVSIAKSATKAEMLQALESAALPVGSYRIKRNAYKNISLNAYGGIAAGIQHYSSDVPDGVRKTNGLLGFTAPIGIAFNWGFVYYNDNPADKTPRKGNLKGASNTVFFSMIDVGAITSFRLTNDTTKALPEIKWENVLAPGLFYIYGFKNSPVSVGGGIQYGPQLRNIKDNSAVILPSAWNYRLFVAIDIPVLNFYTRTEKRLHHEL